MSELNLIEMVLQMQELVVQGKWVVKEGEEGIRWVYDAIRGCHREEDPYYVNILYGNLLAYVKYTVEKAVAARQLVEEALHVMEDIHRECDAVQLIPSSVFQDFEDLLQCSLNCEEYAVLATEASEVNEGIIVMKLQ